MKTFTNEQTNVLTKQAQTMLEGIGENRSVRDVMAKHYAETMEGQTVAQGQEVADTILEAVKSFDADYQRAVEDLDGYLDSFQQKVEEGKSCVERCNYWLKLAGALSVAGQTLTDSEADQEQLVKQLEGVTISEEEATPELEEELRRKARELLKESGILMTGVVNNADDLEELAKADETAELLIDLGNEELEYRAMVSMLAYTSAKTGQMNNVPEDLNAGQMTYMVCAEVEKTKILANVGRCALTVTQTLLNVLGVVAMVSVFAAPVLWVALYGLMALSAGSLFGVFFAGVGLWALFRWFRESYGLWKAGSKLVVKGVSVGASLVVKGMKVVADFVKTTVFPAVKKACKSIFAFLTKRGTKSETEVQPQEEEVVEEDSEVMVDDQEQTLQPNPPQCVALT